MYEWTVWGMKQVGSDQRYFCGTVVAGSLKEARTAARSDFPTYPFFDVVLQGVVAVERNCVASLS
jgi:hypothetical protein